MSGEVTARRGGGTKHSRRYPWQTSGSTMLLDAARDSDKLRFPYRSISVTATDLGARASSVTVAPTYPPTMIGRRHSRDFGSVPEAIAWAEGIYDEALGIC